MTRKQKRFLGIGVIGCVVGLSILLVSIALRDEIVFFFDPTDVVEGGKVAPGQKFRVGGLVTEGSVDKENSVISFAVNDGKNSITVKYDGILPDLFREGQGIIAEGALQSDGIFVAENVLAKHDENYIPKELEDMMKEKEVWKGQETQ